MSMAQKAVERPIFTIMVVLVVIILGGLALTRLPIDLLPDVTFPSLSISTSYGNAAPEEIEQLVTRPIEEALAAVPGVESIESESSEGNSRVRISFNWGTDLDAASNDVRDRLDRIVSVLPAEASRPSLWKFDLSATPIMQIGVTSELSQLELRRLISDRIEYRLERVPGIAAVSVRGGLDREIHINLDPDKIKGLRVPLDQVLSAIRAANVNLPAGSVTSGKSEINIRTPGEFTSLDQLRQTVVLERGGAPITLEQIAAVEDSWARVTRHTRINGQTGVQISLNKQSGTNTVAVARAAQKEIANINRDIPQVKLLPIMDSSVYISRSIRNVGMSAFFGGILAIFVLLFFLRNIKSTAIISTAIPVSVIATFGLLYFSGLTLNLMSLGGLALGVGMLLDNSIVVLENIYRLREKGMGKKQASIEGTKEVTSPIIASTLTTLAVFLPLIFIRGMSGILFKQLSYVIGFSILCSMVTALTLVPMLSSRLLSLTDPQARPDESLGKKLYHRVGGLLSALEDRYKRLLHLALDHRLATVLIAAGLLAGSLLLIPLVGTELMPETDEGEIRVNVEMEPGTKLDITDAVMQRLEGLVQNEVPELRNMVTITGGGGWGAAESHTGFMRLSLVQQNERKRSGEEVANHLRPLLGNIPGAKIRVQPSAGMMALSRLTGGGRLEVLIRGHDLERAGTLAREVQGIMDSVDGVTDSRINRSIGAPEELVLVDRQKAAELGLSVQQIASMLQTVLSGRTAGYYSEDGKEYSIVLQVADEDRGSLEEILNLTLTNSAGAPIVLRNAVSIERGVGATEIERQDQERVTSINANITGRDLGSIIRDIRSKLQGIAIPPDLAVVFGGDYEEQQKSTRELMVGFILALILVYMVMASQYESLRDPFVVMFSVPFAIIGVVLMLFLTGTTFNIQSYIGIIMLGGIVVNNAILLVNTTNQLRRDEKLGVREAIEESGRRRLRPILMTASTTILAMIPMAIGIGEGGEAQAPMARAVVGGMLSSSLITLVFVPVVYSYFEERSRRRKKPAPALEQ
ncbi:MAG: efflux RND transporter permease subunit [Candidatus Syntrophosphaera sp.]|nr:efflux RND transporter permease subunit [Candidatus Syntrophosphaera sp.]